MDEDNPDKGRNIKNFYEKYPFPNTELKDMNLESNSWILKVLSSPIKENSNILDIGCGTGDISMFLSKYGTVQGVDFCEKSIEIANKIKNELKITNVFFSSDDITKEKKRDKFDYIFCIGVLHHIPEMEKAMENIKKCMNKDSVLIIGLNNLWFDRRNRITGWKFKKEHISREKDFSAHPYSMTYTKKDAEKILGNYFQITNTWRNVPEIVRFMTGKFGMMLFECKLKDEN